MPSGQPLPRSAFQAARVVLAKRVRGRGRQRARESLLLLGLVGARALPISSNGFMLILTLAVSTALLSGLTRIFTA